MQQYTELQVHKGNNQVKNYWKNVNHNYQAAYSADNYMYKID